MTVTLCASQTRMLVYLMSVRETVATVTETQETAVETLPGMTQARHTTQGTETQGRM